MLFHFPPELLDKILDLLTFDDIEQVQAAFQKRLLTHNYCKHRCHPWKLVKPTWIQQFKEHTSFHVFGPQKDLNSLFYPISVRTGLVEFSGTIGFGCWIKCHPDIPRDDYMYRGGIVFGYQSLPVDSTVWPHFHWQPLMVGHDGEARGGLDSLAHRHMVGPKVDDGKWHHLMVTATRKSGARYNYGVAFHSNAYEPEHRQELWVDGKLVDELVSPIEHWYVQHMQLGNGIISGDTQGKPLDVWNSAYPFHGLIGRFVMGPVAMDKQEFVKKAAYDALPDAWFDQQPPGPIRDQVPRSFEFNH
ncbi:hypothetical protein EDD86DRAFT_143626 [Gorgonomyces haynaldii]|nr:hypothetical protein EDD86DRAFT_143626 [Gorgonomyces haynaldii]